MTINPPTPQLTWRDLSDQLTPEQIEILERCDTNPPMHRNGPDGHRIGMIVIAEGMAQERLAKAMADKLPAPAGATEILEGRADDHGRACRSFRGTKRVVEATDDRSAAFEVVICGEQWLNRIERGVSISDEVITTEQLDDLIRVLQATKEEIEFLNSVDGA